MTKGLIKFMPLLSAAIFPSCAPAPQEENFEDNPLVISEAPSPFELESFYGREAITILTCIVRYAAQCEHPAIVETEVDSNQADTLSPLGPLNAAMKTRLHEEFSSFDRYVVMWASARVPSPYERRIPGTPPIPPNLLKETWIEVGIDLVNDPTAQRVRLKFLFRDGQLVALSKVEIQLTGGSLK